MEPSSGRVIEQPLSGAIVEDRAKGEQAFLSPKERSAALERLPKDSIGRGFEPTEEVSEQEMSGDKDIP